MHVEGTVLAGRSFEPVRGRVVLEDGRIEAIEETDTDSTAVVCPAFVNAHTHVGDAVAKEAAIGLGLEEAVVPPESVKHRHLREASREEQVDAMRRTIRYMETTGTAAFMDFREFGVEGARKLRDAEADEDVRAYIYGSDDPAVLDVAEGFGASGATDEDFTERREAVRERGRPFAIHAGEPDESDIHPALDLDPDLLVHMVHAKEEHLERVAGADIPIAVCPRANRVLGVGKASIRDLLDHTTVALGTDNVMLNAPSMLREMEYTAKHFDVSAREVLRMATAAGAEIAGLDFGVLEPGREAKLLVFDGESDNLAYCEDPIAGIVRRGDPTDLERVLL